MQQEPPPLAATSSQPASSSAFFEACFVKDVPDKADGWENDFQPAKQYSAQTTLRISQGSLNSAVIASAELDSVQWYAMTSVEYWKLSRPAI